MTATITNMFIFDPSYAYFLVIVVPNHKIMIRQETYVSCDETEMSLQDRDASNTLNAVFIKVLLYKILVWNDQVTITVWNFTYLCHW